MYIVHWSGLELIFKMASHLGGSSPNIDKNAGNFELVNELIASQLRKEGIHLWFTPYTQEETGEAGEFPLVC